jgi:hypothetical protein
LIVLIFAGHIEVALMAIDTWFAIDVPRSGVGMPGFVKLEAIGRAESGRGHSLLLTGSRLRRGKLAA